MKESMQVLKTKYLAPNMELHFEEASQGLWAKILNSVEAYLHTGKRRIVHVKQGCLSSLEEAEGRKWVDTLKVLTWLMVVPYISALIVKKIAFSFTPSIRYDTSQFTVTIVNGKMTIKNKIVKVAQTVMGQEVRNSTRISFHFSHHAIPPECTNFNEYLLSNCGESKKRLLLERLLTLNEYDRVSEVEVYLDTSCVKVPFDQVISQTSTVSLSPNWFDYTGKREFYVDFANAQTFGGGYRGRRGNVQEERMFFEFPALPLLDWQRRGIRPIVREGDKSPPNVKSAPFIITNIKRYYDVSGVPYGRGLESATEKEIMDGIQVISDPVPVHIIGMAAADFSRNTRNYTEIDLKYHLEAAYLGFGGAKNIEQEKTVIHTAPWGCGAFKNSEKMMVALQYLAARMAGVDLVFHGTGNKLNPGYDEEGIKSVLSEMDRYIQEGKTVDEIVQILLAKDASWQPKE